MLLTSFGEAYPRHFDGEEDGQMGDRTASRIRLAFDGRADEMLAQYVMRALRINRPTEPNLIPRRGEVLHAGAST
jgi:hypothetical protein